jgi:hypothetical protein
MDLIKCPNYRSKHRNKLEEKGWSYVGSTQVDFILADGSIKKKWKNYFAKGPEVATTIEALRMEGIK